MKVASYSVAGNYGNYNAAKTSQTSSNKTTFTITDTLSTAVLNFKREEHSYDPFKDIAETGTVNFPEWMQTKTTPTRSDEEILKELEELAKEHARTGEYQNYGRYDELMDEYISSVSPDRKGILEKSAMEIYERLHQDEGYSMIAAFQQIDSQRKKDEKEKEEKEAIDYLLEALKNRGKGKGGSSGTISSITTNGPYSTVNIDHGGGMITHLNYVNGEFASMNLTGNNYYVGGIDSGSVVRAAEFFDDSGNQIMYYNGNDDGSKLMQPWTKEEGKRSQEFFAVYDAAYDVAACETRKVMPNSETYKETYNSTYERLTKTA